MARIASAGSTKQRDMGCSQSRGGGRRQNGAGKCPRGLRAVCVAPGRPGADLCWAACRDAAEPDPRTAQLRPRRPDPAAASPPPSDRDPVLVVPTVDDVFAFERELCAEGAALGGAAMTFGASSARSRPPAAPARRRADAGAAAAGDRGRGRRPAGTAGAAAALRLPPRLRAAPSSGCSTSCRRAGVEPEAVEAGAGDAGGLRLPRRHRHASSPATPRRASATGRIDTHGIAREAIALLRRDGDSWGGRPVFLYGLDDLTPNQLELVAALAGARRGDGRAALRAGRRGAGGARSACWASCASGSAPTRRP